MNLRPATDAEKVDRDRVTASEWGVRLTLPQYLEREATLRAHPWCAGMQTWLLADGPTVLCSCETFRNDSTVGGVAGESHSIASVFTEAHLRGKGYATRLMDALIAHFRATAQSLVLFSDVGAPLYERSGYRAVPAWDWVLPPAEADPDVAWLDAPVPAPERRPGPAGTLVLHPSAGQLDWHHARSRLYARFLNRPPLRHYGARTPDGTAWWTAQFKSDELLVLWLDAPDARAAGPLLRAAQAEAHHAGLPKVRVWETFSLASVTNAQRVRRDGELPMAVPLAAAFDTWTQVQRALWV